MLKTLDDLYIEYLRMKVYFVKLLITTLRNKIFDMYDQKMVEKSNNAQFTGLRTFFLTYKWL